MPFAPSSVLAPSGTRKFSLVHSSGSMHSKSRRSRATGARQQALRTEAQAARVAFNTVHFFWETNSDGNHPNLNSAKDLS